MFLFQWQAIQQIFWRIYCVKVYEVVNCFRGLSEQLCTSVIPIHFLSFFPFFFSNTFSEVGVSRRCFAQEVNK